VSVASDSQYLTELENGNNDWLESGMIPEIITEFMEDAEASGMTLREFNELTKSGEINEARIIRIRKRAEEMYASF